MYINGGIKKAMHDKQIDSCVMQAKSGRANKYSLSSMILNYDEQSILDFLKGELQPRNPTWKEIRNIF